jgi:DNA (cytosine-5)-methyltransferase 1
MARDLRPKVIDVFAGVGGLSLGAARAGFHLAAAVEIDKHAVIAHKKNFPKSKHIDKDITSVSSNELLKEAGLERTELTGLIGGPPCQGFSSIGRRAEDDPRNSLFVTFFQLVAELRPAFFLAENVPGILAERNDAIRNKAFSQLPKSYKILPPFKVKANEYGAPTIRTRVFFIGYDPARVAPLTVEDFRETIGKNDVTVGDALTGIPALGAVWEGDGWATVSEPTSTFFGRRLKGLIPPGIGDKDAIKKYKEKRLVSGFQSTTHTPETITRFKVLAPGKADRISKSVRLNPSGYCPTLRAGTGPERGSYQAVRPVHPTSPRVICPREAARLQGFPDWFQFDSTKWHSFRQIGNSVSPIVAEMILTKIYQSLRID